MTTKKEIGLGVQDLRKRAGLTQEQLGKKMKPKKARKETISRLERGKSNYNINLLFQIAEVLNCDISDFFPSEKSRPQMAMFEGVLEEYTKRVMEKGAKYKK